MTPAQLGAGENLADEGSAPEPGSDASRRASGSSRGTHAPSSVRTSPFPESTA